MKHKDILETFFHNKFTDLIGMQFEINSADDFCIKFASSENVIGNSITNILHGGVIASVLDVMGGFTVLVNLCEKYADLPSDEFIIKISKMATIDLRVDYLRPGRGSSFIATGNMLRLGNKIAVCSMELHNNSGSFISSGTATYYVG